MKLFAISLLTLFVFSCTVTKRRVLPGYHVNWGKYELSTQKEDLESVKYDSDFSDLKNKIKIQKISITTSTSVCDTIFLLDGSSILGKIISLDSKIIEYKSCQDESSFIHKIYKTTIKSISYSNGVVYEHKSETEIKEKRKQLEEKHTEIIKQTKTNDRTSDKEKNNKSIIIWFAALIVLFFGLLASVFFLYLESFLILFSILISLISIFILFFTSIKISKYEKESKNNKIAEENGRYSIILFSITLALIALIFPTLIYGGIEILVMLLLAIFITNIISLFLAFKSLKIMSKNPEQYKSRRVILFFSFLESLILLIYSFSAIFVLSGNFYFGE